MDTTTGALPRFRSIGRRFSYTLIGIVTLLLVVFAFIAIALNIRSIQAELEAKLHNTLNLSTVSLKTLLWNVDHDAVDDFIESLFLDSSIVYGRVLTEDQAIVTKAREALQHQEFDALARSSQFLAQAADITYEDTPVGTIQLVVSRTSIREQIVLNIIGIVTLTLVVITAIAVTSLIITRRYVARPLSELQHSATLIARGELETEIDVGSPDEIGLLARDLNAMTRSLSEHEAALQRKVVETTALYEIGQDVAAQVDLDTTLELIVKRAQVLLGAERAMLALRQTDSDTFLFQAQSGATADALSAVRLQPGQGLGGRVIDTAKPVLVGDYPVDYADSPFLNIVKESGLRSWLGVPLSGQDQVIGVLYVNSSTPHLFNAEDQQLLSALGDQAAIAIEKTQLYEQIRAHAAELEVRVQERTAELATANNEIRALNEQLQTDNLRMGAELEITRRIQHMLLPTDVELQEIDGLDIACYMEPAHEVGGDYYDILQHNGQIKIGIGDVTGHGLESGVIMVMTQAVVRALLTSGITDHVHFLDTLNRTLCSNVKRMGTGKNLTLSLLDYTDGEVKLSGQHEEMIVVRQGGEVELVDTVDLGFPIGLDDEITDFISHATVSLEPGDGVVLYTDGITEAENSAGEQYGLERLCEVVCQSWGQSAGAIKEVVIVDVKRHIDGHEVYDDITLVVAKQQ